MKLQIFLNFNWKLKLKQKSLTYHLHIIKCFFCIFILYCSSTSPKPTLDNYLAGWYGPPDNLNFKPNDYFYTKMVGRASEKAIIKKNGFMMKTSCIGSVESNARSEIISMLVGSTLGKQGPDCEVVECGPPKTIVTYEFPNTLFNNYNLLICIPLGEINSKITLSEWKECQCLLYIYVKGGRNEINNLMKLYRKEYDIKQKYKVNRL